MISEEKIKELKTGIIERRDEFAKKYKEGVDKAESLKSEYNETLGGLKALSELSETDEVKAKVEDQHKKLEDLTKDYNNIISEITALERNIYCYDGVIQCAMYILEENIEEQEGSEK